MIIITGGQTGVDRAAIHVAIERGLPWGGWCPKGGWAEDFPTPPGLLASYPNLRETPLSDPAQRTAWNVRDSDAVIVIVDRSGVAASPGTTAARDHAISRNRPLILADASAPGAAAQVATWLQAQHERSGSRLRLGIAGPRESEAPGIYQCALRLLRRVFSAHP
jgi:hypothetical protein